MKTKIYLPLTALVIILVLQSCVKDPHVIFHQPDDKLLLSKVTGQNYLLSWNSFEFTRDPASKFFNYLATYSYGNEHFGWDDYKPLHRVSFLNTRSWDFTYNNLLPDKIIDNSTPGKDQGYWKLYYNNKGQVIKTGFAFSTVAGPTEFEFYGYDDHNNLTDLVYGKYVDTPLYKLTYAYDAIGNLTQWQMLFPNGYKNADAITSMQIFSSLANSLETQKTIGKPLTEVMKKVIANGNDKNMSTRSLSFKIQPTNLSGDSNVIYQTYYIANITNDGKINPYHQQGRLLFFASSRNYSADINTNHWQLQKSNPVKTEYTVNPDFGDFRPMVSTFTYTYNKLGYPITSHEATGDPDGLWFGLPLSYTQDRQYEYISNH